MSFRSIGKKAKNFSKRVRRFVSDDVSSDSDSDSDSGYDDVRPYNPADDPQFQERMRREEETGQQLAKSPSRMQSEHDDQRRILKGRRKLQKQQQAQAAQERESLRREASEFTHSFEINQMIQNINVALGTDVDGVDPRIRFVIGQIVNVHGLTLHSLRLMRRSTILLSAIGDIANRAGIGLVNASQVVYTAGQAVLAALRAAGSLASRGASLVTSRLPSLNTAFSYLPSKFYSSQPRASGQRASSPDSFLQVQGPPELGFDQVRFSVQAQAPTLEQRLQMDRMLQLQLSPAPASAFGRQSLLSQAPPPPPPPPPASTSAPAVEEEDECSICMEPARDNAVLTRCNHRFHGACVTPWLNSHRTCPMCRNTNPTPLVPAPAKRQRQGGGGSRKTRSKSKTRRLRKSCNKSRKPRKSCKSRKPRSSSRRR
jgi:hypothetical protein